MLKLGIVTYNIAKDWTIEEILANCTEAGIQGVELRTTHAHGVEVSLSPEERESIKKRFDDSPIELAGLGGTFEYHSVDKAEVRRNIEGTKEYALLARDVGAGGIKVRPNGLQTDAGVPAGTTLRQIGKALDECAAFAFEIGVQIRLEIHGNETSRIPNIRRILDYVDNNNLRLCWNCNQSDLLDGGIGANFSLVSDRIGFVHMHDLCLPEYPWRRFLSLLKESGYEGYCCAEIPYSTDPIRLLQYYRALFYAYLD